MNFDDYLEELEEDPEYVAAEQELQPLLDIANDILRLRLAKGWSQAELAQRVGTRQANISRLESGLANPTVEFLQKVAAAFDTDLVIHLKMAKPIQQPQVIHVPDIKWIVLKWPGSDRPHKPTTVRWPELSIPCWEQSSKSGFYAA